MTKEEYFIFAEAFFKNCLELSKKKNSDYTGDSNSPFSNFEGVEVTGCVTTEQGFITRIFDKYKRLCSFVKQKELKVKEESVEDTLMDLANYCVLFAGYIKSKKTNVDLANEILEGMREDFKNRASKGEYPGTVLITTPPLMQSYQDLEHKKS